MSGGVVTLDQVFNSIGFDKMKTDTKLAEEYLKVNKSEFHSVTTLDYVETNQHELDSYGNKIFYVRVDYENIPSNDIQVTPLEDSGSWTDLKAKYRALATKIEENANLFSQLEYLIRDIPMEEVINCDIKLMIQHLLYWCANMKNTPFATHGQRVRNAPTIVMGKRTSLANMASIAPLLINNVKMTIVATKDTAVVSYLFTQLCHQVGFLEEVNLVLVESASEKRRFPSVYPSFEDLWAGCVGVVTEHADVDSAVDAFIAASTRCPWNLQSIFVQESVLETFKRTMKWKSTQLADVPQLASMKTKCTDMFVHDRKVFLVEYIGNEEELNAVGRWQFVAVSAYRSNNELQRLLPSTGILGISLWSGMAPHANELAFNIHVPLFWINNYGHFQGPPKTSQALYSLLDHKYNSAVIDNTVQIQKLINRHKKWLSKDYDERRVMVQRAMEKYKNMHVNNVVSEVVSELVEKVLDEIISWEANNFVQVSKGNVCIGIDKPAGLVRLYNNMNINAIKSLVDGTAFFAQEFEPYNHFIVFLEKNELPITLLDKLEDTGRDKSYGENDGIHYVIYMTPLHQTRVIWTNFGTAFAN